MSQYPQTRRQRAYLTQFSTTVLYPRSPWVVAFFSFSYPGFGHLLLHRYIAGLILILWETFINHNAKINLGIFYSLTGDFAKAMDVIDEQWLMLYVAIYMFGIWDGYRQAVDMNKQYILAEREDAPIQSIAMGTWDINYLDKRKPWVAVLWSVLFPGLGHLYIHKVIVGFFIFAYTVAIMYFGHLPQAIHLTMVGEFDLAKDIFEIQWAMYLPSIYFFIHYDAYIGTIDYNILFEKEMKRFLRKNYQNKEFKFPF